MTIATPIRPLPATPPVAPAPRRRRSASGSGATRTLFSEVEISRGKGRFLYWLTLTLVFLLFLAIFIFPLYWMFSSAVKTPEEYAQPDPTLFPHTFVPETYQLAWDRMRIAKFFANTAFYALGGWLIQLVFQVAVAYALSKLRPIFGKVVLGLMLASLMLPATALLIPAYLTVTDVPIFGWNLLNTPWALWLPAVANAFNIYVLKRFFDQIPNDLLDSAALDGAGRFRVLWSIVLPLSRPVLGVVSIFSIVAIWKDFIWPLLVLQDPETQTLSVALSRLASTSQVPPTQLMAGLAIASVPMIVVFLIFQRSIIGGLAAGSMKG
ncbi:carbohydrate ABC transporter membrane protein 2 (CUT1 family) [Asanoa ferruginea]|uniref:Carbohydrate ABC transporter membrane protein 2 (CUT1 family) n=1 Tax=Asanoa ferruginea TaxID=53367 RepID=A0A3D9ZF53_9ACTN|nr:carbohydrate ABC transporter permease [Asanoa ferruginea]REF96046.1 carbohydrate ABC transporter membrane protein 2 (CUT1 family) [Asanoa ferruginea]GIF48092.1 ABC transporter permease [Asanoa ferruginea]